MPSSKKLTGLFVGAGCSCEIGMPLVWELTDELKKWLTPTKLRALNRSWRSQGGGHPDVVIEDLASVLGKPEMHYESILGFLETQYRRSSAMQRDYHALYSWLVEMVYHIFRLRHLESVGYIEKSIPYLEGIAKLAAVNAPLWIFSLNHDVIIECVATKYGIPLNCGFTNAVVSFPRRNGAGVKVGELNAETITAAELDRGMQFSQHGSNGINLLKIHGALDVFTFRDGKDLVKFLPLEATVAGVIETLRVVNEELIYIGPQSPQPVKTTNEITYADDAGKMQFLRRSLLAGAYKFDNRLSQVLPSRILDHFRANINFVATLVCIGYGFGDLHINEIIRDWLEFDAERRLEVVGPKTNSVPPFLLHLSPQISLADATATDYLDRATGIVRSKRELLEKRLGLWIRQNSNKVQAEKDLVNFLRDHQERVIAASVQKLAAFPVRNGDLDFSAHGQTPEQVARDLLKESDSLYEGSLEAFLQANANPS
jgi:hypothetical protein